MTRLALIACAAVIGCGALPTHLTTRAALAADAVPNVDSPEFMRQTLNQQAGKRVKIRLNSGQEIDGKLSRIGAHGVVISELAGMEFFEANVRLDQIASVIVRSAGK